MPYEPDGENENELPLEEDDPDFLDEAADDDDDLLTGDGDLGAGDVAPPTPADTDEEPEDEADEPT